jgi:hypothetical protein
MREEPQRGKPDTLIIKDDGQGGNVRDSSPMPHFISDSSHPGVAMLHILLKIGILFLYLILPLFASVFNQLVIVIILGAVDFWIVKNVAGRLLVGLRWWIDFDENGEEQWKFECKVDEKQNSGASDKAFWWTLIIFSLIWVALVIINLLKLDITQITITVFCLVLLGFNLYSYYRCSKVQRENVNRLLSQYGADAAGKFMRGSIIAGFV